MAQAAGKIGRRKGGVKQGSREGLQRRPGVRALNRSIATGREARSTPRAQDPAPSAARTMADMARIAAGTVPSSA
jgi:hypothetical protein